MAEVFGKLTWDPWIPITVHGQATLNTAASRRRAGWMAGITVGRTLAVHGLEVGWSYRRLEADATISALADSDFGGGGTGVAGHRALVRWRVSSGTWLNLSWTSAHSLAAGQPRHTLWQLDTIWHF